MVEAVSGFLSNDGSFFETEDEARYQELLQELYRKIGEGLDVLEGFKPNEEQRELLFNTSLAFLKENASVVTELLAVYGRLDRRRDQQHRDDEVVGQTTEGDPRLRERVRSKHTSGVGSIADAEDPAVDFEAEVRETTPVIEDTQ